MTEPSPVGGEKKRFITLVLRAGFPHKFYPKGFMRLDESVIGFQISLERQMQK